MFEHRDITIINTPGGFLHSWFDNNKLDYIKVVYFMVKVMIEITPDT